MKTETCTSHFEKRQSSFLVMLTLTICMILSLGMVNESHAARHNYDKKGNAQEVKVSKLEGGLRYRVLVDDFVDKSAYNYTWSGHRITQAWKELLANALFEQGSFIAIASRDDRVKSEGEQDYQDSEKTKNTTTVAKKGYMAGANLIIRGVVTNIQKSSGIKAATRNIFKGIGIGRDSYKVTMIIKVVDAQTGIQVASKEITGTSADWNLGLGNIGGFNLAFGKNKDLVKAASDALKKAAEFCAEQLGTILWMGYISDAEEQDDIIINRGEREGVKVGQIFEVGKAKPIYDPETGELISYRKRSIGQLVVTEIESKAAFCKPVSSLSKPVDTKMNIWLPKK